LLWNWQKSLQKLGIYYVHSESQASVSWTSLN